MTTTILWLVIIGTGGIALYLLLSTSFEKNEKTSRESLEATLNFLQEGMADQGALDMRNSTGSEMLDEVLNSLGPIFPVATPQKMELLNKAGLRAPNAFIMKCLEQLIAGAMGFTLPMLMGVLIKALDIGFVMGLIMGAMMYFFFWESVSSLAKKRGVLIDKTIPDIIDLFANACAAGASFDMAADFILNQLPSKDPMSLPIKEDLLAWQADVRFGVPREDAWKKLVARSYSKNMKYFANLMDQSEKTGGSAAESLLKMADFFRERRKQQIEAEIAQLKGKLNTLTIIFIVVPILVLIVMPIGMQVTEAMKQISSN